MRGPSDPVWRLLDTGAADGFSNMAIDEALLEIYAAQGGPSTLRFYTWSPPALSLGYAQPLEPDIDPVQCRSLGIDLVRRPTGGRAVLHEDEVTYSMVMRADAPQLRSGLLAPYLLISQGLVRGLSYLGIQAELLPLRRSPSQPSAVCFATASSYEVTVAGRKIVGSAQRRAQHMILQHGSIPLSHNREHLRALFRAPRRAETSPDRAPESMTSLREAGGRSYCYAEVVAALTRGLAEIWQVDFCPGHLTVAERELSARLRTVKYRTAAWTQRH